MNAAGQEVATLMAGRQGAGNYRCEEDASSVASGVYYYILLVGDLEETKKLIVLK